MIDEKSSAHNHKLKGSVIEGGVIDDNANMAVFYPGGDAAMGSASLGRSKWATEETTQVRVHGGSCIDDVKMACIFAKVEFVRYVSNMCTNWLHWT